MYILNENSVKDWQSLSNKTILESIGKFVQHHRLEQNKSQDFVSKAAGISRSTLSLLERGEKVRIDSLIQVLRVLELLSILHIFEIKEEISPVEYAKLKKNKRKKASPKKEIDE